MSTTVNVLQNVLNLKLSDEQLAIINNDFQRPMLINACAGSGKTTTFILTALKNIIDGQVAPDDVLGVTFSKKAQLDMRRRYHEVTDRLSTTILDFKPVGEPYFATFHALFFRLLRHNSAYKNVQVLENINDLKRELKRLVKHHSAVLTKNELLDRSLALGDYLINQNLSRNGYELDPELVDTNDFVAGMHVIEKTRSIEYDDGFLQDHQAIMQRYETLKRMRGLIDFNDMRLLLLNDITNDPALKAFYRDAVAHFQMVFIDEFQDIDPLQWELITRLLPPDTLNKLVAIGDDDQTIYQFRGSSPEYILHFDDYLGDTVTRNLSTNYRTGETILDAAVPMITKNWIRLDKELIPNRIQRGMIQWHRNEHYFFDENDAEQRRRPIIDKLIEMIKDKTIPNRDLVVLSRYNVTRSVVSDYLANNDIFVNLTSRDQILQRQPIYQGLVAIMESFWTNNFTLLRKHERKLGDWRYQKHWTGVMDWADPHPRTVSAYVQAALAFDWDQGLVDTDPDYLMDCQLQHLRKVCIATHRQLDLDLLAPSDEETITLKDLYLEVYSLTQPYFDAMLGRDYLSRDHFEELTSYLEERCLNSSLANFFEQEKAKCLRLNKLIGKERRKDAVAMLSLHQSKGLEFQTVFLFGLSAIQVIPGTLVINALFKPNVDYETYCSILENLPSGLTNKELLSLFITARMKNVGLVQQKRIDLTKITIYTKPDEQEVLHDLFVEVKRYSKLIEEERRLLYVGMTRSRDYLLIDEPHNPSPLLTEEVHLNKAQLV